jgi:hypothetical protein
MTLTVVWDNPGVKTLGVLMLDAADAEALAGLSFNMSLSSFM